MHESWLPVVGYEGYYEVSDQGHVRSLDRKVQHPTSGTIHVPSRILRHKVRESGHRRVTLHRDGRGRQKEVHCLVLEAFVSPRPDGMEARHFPDRDPSNNRVENLQWDTHRVNMGDRRTHGTDHELNKTHCPRGHALLNPNLRSSKMIRGWRECLSCHRARAWLQKNSDGNFAERADAEYRRLMPLELFFPVEAA